VEAKALLESRGLTLSEQRHGNGGRPLQTARLTTVRMDGGPHQLIAPGGSRTATWRIDQPAATLWYQPHPHGQTADHVYRGVAGMFPPTTRRLTPRRCPASSWTISGRAAPGPWASSS
jgi:hypothetical protein